MSMLNTFHRSTISAFSLFLGYALAAAPLGIFEKDSSVTPGQFAGHADFNGFTGEYTVTGSGGEIGGKADGFHYVWTRMTGDVTVNADARFIGTGSTERSQAALMIRQSLDPDAAYAAALIYGNGKSTAQYRVDKGASSKGSDFPEYTNMAGTVHLSIERRGHSFTIAAGRMGKRGGPMPVSAPVTVTMNGPVYVGLAVGSLNEPQRQANAVFGNVSIQGTTVDQVNR
jgi:TolB protein